MARYLLDTNVLISLSKQREPAYSWMFAREGSLDELGVCDIVVAGFFTGLPPSGRSAWEPFFNAMSFWETSFDAAKRAGVYRHEAARRGQAISTSDGLIAAVSVEVRATIVTTNIRHFPMPDIVLLALR